ncbi:MAG: YggS family pyridoxal phosphate-dependent enzyme [Alphaproteobacteria bacterium]|nr:YggS family pyridoxal phosphate-dependent enzyme [Alphaproteobacteria bacterium]MBU0798888.1 YggS family pyridoxal phosphate-dependent enzyme [Alphaproteobacteria bacterium]MBU0885602.1 YggS family pyridoxal phosphate-dependent enzyme [Alphaproteobacteria bacterium]MBU1813528.1 YggS family pyridoxal phosphate-dependent enzyme [Alphaproteobacteria bacterium]MBU2091199.1 YggS family pyridoxal phosphate-dependent enzyme [Alphaproteobacteria bacterium]
MPLTPASESLTQAIRENIEAIHAAISKEARAVRRAPTDIRLIAVSKAQPADRIAAALAAGQRVFGENRVQEAEARWAGLREDYPDLELHLIGPLQSNKVREAVALFDVIESLDRPKLAEALAKEMEKTGRSLPCYVQVNTGEEEQKAGILPEAADAFIAQAKGLGLDIIGLMCIPPVEEEPGLHFGLLREIARRNGLTRLSMGMSADYQAAIAFGATDIRVGTAIFGLRGDWKEIIAKESGTDSA